ncbi:VLRF1 family aeRF1-type release factor [Salibacterium qingdaonense]|uniref:Protein required for attachment to host cells n=1 Tax=Salibacterium qingdaonense TaxID=266892 RepID=A0A1I4MK86_9BACI|nr:VLRF1 family aeRF1-type release factor [Salibacterium qingdaonense]SFM03661.1 Protein required for attachment to host cells [Salibacterium qingdaonense]
MTLADELKTYKQQEDQTGILTIYLNTDFADGSQHGGEWKIRLKNGLKHLKEYIETSGTKEEEKAYKKLADQANKEIYDQQMNLQKGFVFMASADGEFHVEKIVQVPVETAFHWESYPVVDQLEELQTEFPAVGILLVQKSDVVLIDAALGEVRDEKHFSWEVESEDWKQYKGNASSDRTSSGSTQVDEVQQRFEENRHRWYKQLAPVLDKEIKNRNLRGVYLIGSKESIEEVEEHLNSTIINKVTKNLISKPAHEILNIVYDEEVR